MAVIREAAAVVKKKWQNGEIQADDRKVLIQAVLQETRKAFGVLQAPQLRRVVNATGIILHTGLGRAPLAEAAVRQLQQTGPYYCNLETDLQSGERGDRQELTEPLLCRLTGAEAACVVNNNAAALLIALNSLAYQKEVIVSRGQLIEIGGSFRLPEVMEKSGVKIREVGTTNKTRLSDYLNAINTQTGAILVAHTSNYRVLGFTQEVPLEELTALGRKKKLPLIYDLGGGVMIPLETYGLPHEPVVSEAVRKGADLVTFSGDKLLGAAQCGILIGRKKYIRSVRTNPLMRALRCDKMTYAVLEATLRLYLHPESLTVELPVLRMLTETIEVQQTRAETLFQILQPIPGITLEITEETAQAGSGTLPLEKLKSVALSVTVKNRSPKSLAEKLRLANVPVIGYIKNNRLMLNLRTIRDDELSLIRDSFLQSLGSAE